MASAAGESVDNKRRAEIVRQQETMIMEEEKEKMEESLEKEAKVMFVAFVLSTILYQWKHV